MSEGPIHGHRTPKTDITIAAHADGVSIRMIGGAGECRAEEIADLLKRTEAQVVRPG